MSDEYGLMNSIATLNKRELFDNSSVYNDKLTKLTSKIWRYKSKNLFPKEQENSSSMEKRLVRVSITTNSETIIK